MPVSEYVHAAHVTPLPLYVCGCEDGEDCRDARRETEREMLTDLLCVAYDVAQGTGDVCVAGLALASITGAGRTAACVCRTAAAAAPATAQSSGRRVLEGSVTCTRRAMVSGRATGPRVLVSERLWFLSNCVCVCLCEIVSRPWCMFCVHACVPIMPVGNTGVAMDWR
jgi:hypothetical protein